LSAETRQHRGRFIRAVGDFFLAVEFEPAVIVQRQDTGQAAAGAGRLEHKSVRARAKTDRPGDLFAGQAVFFPAAFHPDIDRKVGTAAKAQDFPDLILGFRPRFGQRKERPLAIRLVDPVAKNAQMLVMVRHTKILP